MSLTDKQLIEIAKKAAVYCPDRHDYMPNWMAQDWQPHQWVINAMRDAVQQTAAGLLNEAYETGYSQGQNDPDGYGDKAERDACVAGLLKGSA